MNPDAGEGSGTVASWLVSATFIRRNSDWNALLKCAAWLLPSSSTSSLFSTSPRGPKMSSKSVDRVGGRCWDCASAAGGAAITVAATERTAATLAHHEAGRPRNAICLI